MQALFGGFGPSATITISLRNVEGRPSRVMAFDGTPPAPQFIYSSGDTIEGDVTIALSGGKKLEHTGIKIELKGIVDMFDRSVSSECVSVPAELAAPGALTSSQSFPFSFPRAEMPYESYEGVSARCRYMLRVTLGRGSYASALTKDLEFQVQNRDTEPTSDAAVKLEVGIEDCLHIEFEYDRAKYHLADVVTGRVNFLLVRIRIKYMEVTVIRREVTGIRTTQPTTESETLTRFEIMDGCPVRGEIIPVRLYLSGLDLTPSYPDVGNAFAVRYFLNLVLVDEEERRYFKQQEIHLWRKELTEKPFGDVHAAPSR